MNLYVLVALFVLISVASAYWHQQIGAPKLGVILSALCIVYVLSNIQFADIKKIVAGIFEIEQFDRKAKAARELSQNLERQIESAEGVQLQVTKLTEMLGKAEKVDGALEKKVVQWEDRIKKGKEIWTIVEMPDGLYKIPEELRPFLQKELKKG